MKLFVTFDENFLEGSHRDSITVDIEVCHFDVELCKE